MEEKLSTALYGFKKYIYAAVHTVKDFLPDINAHFPSLLPKQSVRSHDDQAVNELG